MTFLTKIVNIALSSRLRSIERFCKESEVVQQKQFQLLIKHLSDTLYGQERGIKPSDSYNDFVKKIPVVIYDDLKPYVDKIREGESNILWNSPINWFAKSSGTTADVSKYLPISASSLKNCHYRGGLDVLALFTRNYPNSHIFGGKTMTLGGSHTIDALSKDNSALRSGDLSAIMIENTPALAAIARTPSKKTALIPDFELKVEQICKECVKEDVRAFAGVPSWNMVLLNKVLDYTGKKNICEVWPNMELFIHGGVGFEPYRDQYKRLIPSSNMKYMETYNASEGFFALQDNPSESDMLLMLDYEIFFEFLDTANLNSPEKAIPLNDVKPGVNYAMIISTSGGLWRYMIGDTVMFSSVSPYKMRITGRTKHFINAFGEEVIIDNAEQAIREASKATGAIVEEYTAAPIYMEGKEKGSHQWIFEFSKEPNNFNLFKQTLDESLQHINSDYGAKRSNNTTLNAPVITKAPSGTFYEWMRSRGKLGGQNKIPRLSNNRNYVEQLLEIIGE